MVAVSADLLLLSRFVLCSLVTDKLRLQDVEAAGDALSSALFVAAVFGLVIQITLLVRPSPLLLLLLALLHM